jgi:hypothetical protein
MPHYKDLENKLHFLDSTEFEHLLPTGCIPITDEEAEQIRLEQEAAIPVIIPVLTPRQARIMLLNIGLLDDVEALITTPEQHIWWDYSTSIERTHPLVSLILTSLGKTEEEIDELFISAAIL